jgi:hypothetical protein
VLRGPAPPADRALRLVPADALLYVHLSTDPDREPDRRLLGRLAKLPAFAPLKKRLDAARPWLGDEAAYVVTPRGTALLLAVRAGKKPPSGRVVDGFLVEGVLAKGPRLKRTAELPDDRALDVYAASSILPAPLDRGPLTAAAIPTDDGVRVEARMAADAADFEPELLGTAPEDAFAHLGADAGAVPGLPKLARPLVETLGEVALTISPGPVVTLVARTSDPRAARRALAGLQGVAAAALSGSGETTGQLPVFEERPLKGGHDAYALTLAGGGELIYTVTGDRVIVSSAETGITQALAEPDGLRDAKAFNGVVTGVPDSVQALAFLDFDQLLELADESGLDAAETYRAARPNLARIRALGAVVRRQGDDTTAELNLLIP